MSARQPLAAGGIVAGIAVAVVIGWTFDITLTKSVIAGWRVMVPVTAVSFVLIGIALMLAARFGKSAIAQAAAGVALFLPLLSFIEHLAGIRLGIENWFGVRFDPASTVAGRMSPFTAICCMALAASIATRS